MKSYEINDGAQEVVDEHPERRRRKTPPAEVIAATPSGGHMAAMQLKAQKSNQRFALMRRSSGAVKIALAHLPVFKALQRLHMQKRYSGEADPGVSLAELQELAPEANGSVIRALIQNGAVQRRTTHTGWQGLKARYSPTEFGAQLLAMVETFGAGVLFQIGGQANGWRGRNLTEPPNLFQCADLIRRGLSPENA